MIDAITNLKLKTLILFGCLFCATLILPYYLFVMSPQSSSFPPNFPILAECVIQKGPKGVHGRVSLSQLSPSEDIISLINTLASHVEIEADILGLSKGLHGFHIHKVGNLSEGCLAAGPHYNPFEKNHGGPSDDERHVGDLGNIESSGESVPAHLKITDHLVQLHGEYSVLGRAFVVHKDPDDLGKGGHSDSLTTGHAGERLACCKIRSL